MLVQQLKARQGDPKSNTSGTPVDQKALKSAPSINKILIELQQQKQLFEKQDRDDESSGSDSEPSEDELKDEEKFKIFPKQMLSQKLQNLMKQKEEEEKARQVLASFINSNANTAPRPQKQDASQPTQIESPIKRPGRKHQTIKSPAKNAVLEVTLPLELTQKVDKCTQTDSSFLQEYYLYLHKNKLLRKQQPKPGQMPSVEVIKSHQSISNAPALRAQIPRAHSVSMRGSVPCRRCRSRRRSRSHRRSRPRPLFACALMIASCKIDDLLPAKSKAANDVTVTNHKNIIHSGGMVQVS